MRILAIASTFPRYKGSKDAPFMYYMYKNMIDLGHEVRVIVPKSEDSLSYELMDGIEIFRFHYFLSKFEKLCYGSGMMSNVKTNNFLFFLLPFFLFSELVNTLFHYYKYKPDIIHTTWIIPQGIIGFLISFIIRKPIVSTSQGADMFLMSKWGKWGNLFTKTIISRFKTATAVNKAFVEELSALKSTSAIFIPNGADKTIFNRIIDFDKRKLIERKYSVDISKKTILFVGRLAEKKGIDYLIKSCVGLKKRLGCEVQCIIVGDGIMRDSLVNLSKDLKVSDIVNFTGWIDHELLPEMYRIATVFVAPSYTTQIGDREGLPNVYVEAMACGTPVITTRIDGIESIFEDMKNALLVDQKSETQLNEAISKLFKDNKLRTLIRDQAYQDFINKFEWKIIARSYIGVFEKALNT